MATRKSQIIAELKLQGQAAFKTGLTDVGKSAKKLGSDLQAIRPITFDGGANQAKKSWALTEEHQRAHHRVLERQAKANKARMEAMGGTSGIGGKPAAGGRGGAYGLGVAYNFVQDAAQGGVAGIANNIPQIVELVAKSPALKIASASIATIALSTYAAYEGINLYKNTGDRQLSTAGDRYATNKMAANSVNSARDAAKARGQAGIRGDNESARQAGFSQVINSEIANKERLAGYAEEERKAASELKQERISAIEDPLQRERESAAEQIALSSANIKASKDLLREKMRIADVEQKSVETQYRAIRNELNSQSSASKTPAELNREIELNKTLVGVQVRLNEARARSNDAAKGMDEIKQQEKLLEIERQRLQVREQAAEKQKEQDMKEGLNAFDTTYRDFRRQKIEADRKLADDQKEKDKTANEARQSLKDDQARAKMSPRKLQKFEDAQKLKSETESLIKQGVPKAEAEQMAKDRMALDKPRVPGRIRGAGYGQKDNAPRGLGSTSFTGLDALEDMQPTAPNRRVQGAGRDKTKQAEEKQKQGSPDQSLMQVFVRKIDELKAVITSNGPSRNDRSKPISTTNR